MKSERLSKYAPEQAEKGESREQKLATIFKENLQFSPTSLENASKQMATLVSGQHGYQDRMEKVDRKLWMVKGKLAALEKWGDQNLEDDELAEKKELQQEKQELETDRNEILETQKLFVESELHRFIQVFALPKNLRVEDLEVFQKFAHEKRGGMVLYNRVKNYLERPVSSIRTLLQDVITYPVQEQVRERILDEVFKHFIVNKESRLSPDTEQLAEVAQMSVEGIERRVKEIQLSQMRKELKSKQAALISNRENITDKKLNTQVLKKEPPEIYVPQQKEQENRIKPSAVPQEEFNDLLSQDSDNGFLSDQGEQGAMFYGRPPKTKDELMDHYINRVNSVHDFGGAPHFKEISREVKKDYYGKEYTNKRSVSTGVRHQGGDSHGFRGRDSKKIKVRSQIKRRHEEGKRDS